MWQSEIHRAEPLVDWPTDGIPTVRPNLGVIFAPSIAGLKFHLPENAMPWPGKPLSRQTIRASRSVNVSQNETMRLAEEFYAIHAASDRSDIAAYHPDTQGVFDIAHLLWGEEIFCDLADMEQSCWIEELLDLSLDLYLKVTNHVKSVLHESTTSMIHGHGSSQGLFFPNAGVRMAEDTATLLSPSMIDRRIMPAIEKAAARFGGAFLHFCGKHNALFERLCACKWVRAIDLGNPESYEPRWLLERCAQTGKVLYSRMAAQPGEDWLSYVQRLAALVRETGGRVVLRPMVFPKNREDCAAMRNLWHELT
jgi:hypothetical protein